MTTTIEKLMRIAEKELENILPEDQFADDWRWDETCFMFTLYKCNEQKHTIIEGNVYSFSYDEDEEFYGTAEEQLKNWLDWFFRKEERFYD